MSVSEQTDRAAGAAAPSVPDEAPAPSVPDEAPAPSAPDEAPPPSAWRRRVTRAVSVLFVLFVLLLPTELEELTPGTFLRLPIEALVGVALVLALPARVGRVVAAVIGVLIGVLGIVKVFDMGFFAVLARPFDPMQDWTFLTAGADYVGRSYGRVGEAVAVIVAVLVAIGLVLVTARAAVRLSRLVTAHRGPVTRTVAALTVVWVGLAAFGVPIADSRESALAYEQVHQVHADIADHATFKAEAAVDAFRDTPGSQLLTALRGKDVIIAYVESYGRVALEDPVIAPGVRTALATGTAQLLAAGFGSRSAYLTSSTYAGGSWLAHSSLESGLWINSQLRYHDLVASDRLTLTGAFHKAGWRTVAVMPANTQEWPEQTFFGDDKVYDDRNLGYRGERFTFNSMADQYTLGTFQRLERGPGHAPVMAQVVLLSSHSPWTPVPGLIDWNDVGEGFAFRDVPAPGGEPSDPILRTNAQVRADYGRTIQYSMNTLVSYVEHYGDDNLVLVLLGDHQPDSIVSGDTANRDAPISIIAHDPAVLDRVAGWDWSDGLTPGPAAPIWRMDRLRDKVLSAFGP